MAGSFEPSTDRGTTAGICRVSGMASSGELCAAGELLLAPLRDALERSAIRSAAEDVEVVEGALGDRAEVLGALALALRSGKPLTTRPALTG